MKAGSNARVQKINKFVAEKTHGKIKDLVDPPSLNKFTRLILVNAIYFKWNWASKFYAEETKKETFYQAPGKEIQVDMMQKETKVYFSPFPTLTKPEFAVPLPREQRLPGPGHAV